MELHCRLFRATSAMRGADCSLYARCRGSIYCNDWERRRKPRGADGRVIDQGRWVEIRRSMVSPDVLRFPPYEPPALPMR
jgi:hypothetical protein